MLSPSRAIALLLRSTTLNRNSFSLPGLSFSAALAADAKDSSAAHVTTSDFLKNMDWPPQFAAWHIIEQAKPYTSRLEPVKKRLPAPKALRRSRANHAAIKRRVCKAMDLVALPGPLHQL